MKPGVKRGFTQRPATLRRYLRPDGEQLAELFTDPDVMRFVDNGPMAASAKSEMINKILAIYESDPTFHIWAVQEREEYAGHAELKRGAAQMCVANDQYVKVAA